jgi:formylglycine-generating enzyme
VIVRVLAVAALAAACTADAPRGDTVAIPAGKLDTGGVTVEVAAFRLDTTEVTNRRFAEFVAATGHVTDAERIGDSVVFRYGEERRDASRGGAWELVAGASWRHPEGPGSDIASRMDHPVVHVSFDDALRFAEWAGKRLPTEAEWQWARTSGDPRIAPAANLWQGRFPDSDRGEDGFFGTAPVGSFPRDRNGAHDLAGNVWEWVATERGSGPLAALHLARAGGEEPGLDHQIRGGSFLCARGQCEGYRADARQFKGRRDASNNVGFRCASDG